VRAVLEESRLGLIDNWLRHVADVADDHRAELDLLSPDARVDRLCELNVMRQVENVCQTTIVEEAWARGQDLTVHGLVYGLGDGLLRDLGVRTDRGGRTVGPGTPASGPSARPGA
jgi:carbonic anhydrase